MKQYCGIVFDAGRYPVLNGKQYPLGNELRSHLHAAASMKFCINMIFIRQNGQKMKRDKIGAKNVRLIQ